MNAWPSATPLSSGNLLPIPASSGWQRHYGDTRHHREGTCHCRPECTGAAWLLAKARGLGDDENEPHVGSRDSSHTQPRTWRVSEDSHRHRSPASTTAGPGTRVAHGVSGPGAWAQWGAGPVSGHSAAGGAEATSRAQRVTDR